MRTYCLLFGAWLTSFASFGQALIGFSNDANSPVYTNALAFGGTRGLMAGPQGYYFGLFIAPGGVTDPNALTFTGAYATNTPVPGHYNGGPVQISFWPVGQSYTFQVRGWSANLGHDWAVISAQETAGWADFGYFGEGPLVTVVNPGGSPPAPPLQVNFGTFDLMAVPEPTVATLAGLVLMCLVGRWRRSR